MKISYYALSFIGRRKNNEDNCIAVSLTSDIHFLAVADGMGGMAAGEIASKIVLETSIKYLHKSINTNLSYFNLKQILFKIFQASQIAITNKIHNDNSLSGMGSTLSCVLIYKDKFVVGNIGDSRVYLYRNGQLKQITDDHNYITDYIKKEGKMPDKIQAQQYGHFITKALDGGTDEPDIFPKNGTYFSLKSGDAFLVCTDGLITDKIEKDTNDFKNYLIGTKTLEQAAKNLISYAFYAGSTDNISVVLAEIGELKRKKIKLKNYPYPPNNKSEYVPPLPIKRKKLSISKILYFLSLIIIIIFAYTLFMHRKPQEIPKIKSSKKIILPKEKSEKIIWNPLKDKLIKGRLILGGKEDLIWREPESGLNQIQGYEVVIKDLPSGDVVLKKEIKKTKISIDALQAGHYTLTLSIILKNRKKILSKKFDLQINK